MIQSEPTTTEMLSQLTKSVLDLSKKVEALVQRVDILCIENKGNRIGGAECVNTNKFGEQQKC